MRMKKLKLLLFSVFALAANSILAGTRSFDEIQTVASNTLANSGKVYLADVKTKFGDTICYTFKGENGGYAILSADTRVPALLAYSSDGKLNPEVQEMLDVFVRNIDKNRHQNMELPSSTSELRATRITDGPIEPLLKNIAWGQEHPFNMNAPTINKTKTPAGCVATAVSQILYYYRYPVATLSDIPAYTTATDNIEMPGVKKGTKFDWENMLDSYEGKYTDIQAKAVSDLISVVDAAVEMDFGVDVSYSPNPCVDELVNIFGYDPDLIRISFRSSYSFAQWSQLIYNELKNKRPVLMAGSTMTSGHRFLCDGIDKDGLFHINWGWGGHFDGYFDLAVLNPNTTTEPGSSLSNDGYTNENYIVYGIQPDNGEVDAIEKNPITDALSVQCLAQNDSYYLFFTFANLSLEQKSVKLASGYIDDEGNVVNVHPQNEELVMDPISFYKQTNAYALNMSNFKEGKTYKVGLIESTDGKTWTPCNGFDNVNCTFTVKDGVVSYVDGYELSASIEMTDFNYIGQYAHGIIHLNNSGTKEYNNTLYLMTNSKNEIPEYYTFASCVTSEAGDSNDVEFKFVPTSDTVYYWLIDADMNVIKNGSVVKGNKKYKLSASVSIDTTDDGMRMCRLYIRNDGESYYDNIVITALYNLTGYYRIEPNVCLKPGEETVISAVIPNDSVYSRYSVYDYNGKQIAFSVLDSSLIEQGEVSVYLDYDRYYTSDKIVKGNLTVNNGTSESHVATYYIELDTTGDFRGVMLDSFHVNAPAHSVLNIPLTLAVDMDTCGLIIYNNLSPRKVLYTLYAVNDIGTETYDLAVTDNDPLNVWTMDGSIVAEAMEEAYLRIATIDGRILVSRRLHKGEIFRQEFPSAIYIVNGKKILVR